MPSCRVGAAHLFGRKLLSFNHSLGIRHLAVLAAGYMPEFAGQFFAALPAGYSMPLINSAGERIHPAQRYPHRAGDLLVAQTAARAWAASTDNSIACSG